jgi:hypothetical protein
MITQAELKQLVNYDPITGVFTLAKHRHGTTRKIGDVLGSVTKVGYLETGINRKRYYLHRLAYLYMTGKFPKDKIDHKNRNKADNSWDNLRCVTQQENMENNILPRKHGSLGYRGVHRYGNKFRAKIVHKGKQIHLGAFDTAEEVAKAYLKAKPLIHINYYKEYSL